MYNLKTKSQSDLLKIKNSEVNFLKTQYLYKKGKCNLDCKQYYEYLHFTLYLKEPYLSKKLIRYYSNLGYIYEGYKTVDTKKLPTEKILAELKKGNKKFSMVIEIKNHVFKKIKDVSTL